MSEESIDYGRYLQTHRRAKGMSLEVVSQKTKISIASLQQIESEDWANLPAPTFVKGFVRVYAKVVGADVQEALKRYEANSAMHQRVVQTQAPLAAPSRFWLRMLLVCLIFAVLVGATLYIARQIDSPAPASPPEETATPEAAPPPMAGVDAPADAPAAQATIPPTEPPEPMRPIEEEKAPIEAPARETADAPGQVAEEAGRVDAPAAPLPPEQRDPLVLRVTAVETTWLRITRDHGEPREMTLHPGSTATLEAETGFQLLIGNAGGIRLTLNDQPVRVPGRSGQVVTLHLP
jgi:cytoskeleton protein RodZ